MAIQLQVEMQQNSPAPIWPHIIHCQKTHHLYIAQRSFQFTLVICMPFLVHRSNIKPIAQMVRIHDSLPSGPKGTLLLQAMLDVPYCKQTNQPTHRSLANGAMGSIHHQAMLDVTYQIQSQLTAPLQASSWPKILKQNLRKKRNSTRPCKLAIKVRPPYSNWSKVWMLQYWWSLSHTVA
jgi:hypothetical protein